MARVVLCVALITLVCTVAFAQDLTSRPTFEVASIRPTPPSNVGSVTMNCSGGPGTADPGRLSCTNASLKMLICVAYGVQYDQVAGPGSIDTDRYEIAAKISVDATKAQYRLMMQDLLAERFQLVLHRETRDLMSYSLVVPKGGSKMQRSANDITTVNGPVVGPGMVVSTVGGQVRVTAKKQELSNLAGFLSTLVGVGGPVSNDTGLTGDYDFILEYTYQGSLTTSDNNGLSLFTALESQLGLKLEAKKRPIDVLVVDHTERRPSEN